MSDWSNKYSKVFYLLGFILWMILFYGIYNFNTRYILNDLGSNGMSIAVKFKTSEKDVFQLFYRDSSIKFNEKLSEKIPIEGSNEYQWIKFPIPDTLDLMQIRFDFGNKHKVTSVEIDQFRFEYNSDVRKIERDSILSYFRKNGYVTIEANGVFGRNLIGNRSDPFLLSNDLRPIIRELKEREGDSTILLNLALSSVLSLSIMAGQFWAIRKKRSILTKKHLFVIFFLAMIYMPILDTIFTLDATKVEEKRELSTKPFFSYAKIADYPKKFETYFNDNFGFRKAMISYGGLIKAKIFHTSPNAEKVIIGKNGWLFYWERDIQFSYKNERPWSSSGAQKMESMLASAQNWAKGHNKYFLATIYPNKHSVYEEKLPKRIRNLKRDTIDRTTQTFNIFKNLKIPYVEHMGTFQEAKPHTQLYYKNDTHWNSNGAFYGYTSIVNRISRNVDGVPSPLGFDEFKTIENEDYPNGDLLDFMGVDNTKGYFADTGYSYRPKEETKLKTHKDYLGPRTLLIVNESLKKGKTLLVIGDSFSNELLKFLPLNFERTYFVRNVKMDLKWMDKVDPDVILYGIVERNLEIL